MKVNPICEDGGVEVRRAKPVILWKKYLWYYGFVNLLSVHFDLSTCVNYLHSLYAAMKLVKEITNQAINWDNPPMPQYNSLELNQIQNHGTVSTAHPLSPLKIYGVELIELDCNTFKNGVHPHKGGTKKIQGEGQGVQV